MKLLKQRSQITETRYFYVVSRKEGRGGFAYLCDANGTMNDEDKEAACLKLETGLYNAKIEKRTHITMVPAVLECGCGKPLTLRTATNTCNTCQTSYNSFGQLLPVVADV